MTVFDNRRALWLWMFSAQAERTWDAALATARNLAGADLLLVKALDGQTWMSAFDTAPGALNGPDALQRLQAQAAAGGSTVVPWVVPHGRGDAPTHAALGGTLLVDLEPYQSFWTDTADGVPVYLAGLRAGGVQQLYVSVDPRPQALAALNATAWAGTVDGLVLQTYWTDFGAPPLDCLAMIVKVNSYGVPVVPVLPGNGARDYATFWSVARGLGCSGVAAWHMGSMDAAALRSLAALEVGNGPPAQDLCRGLRDQLAAVTAECDRLVGGIRALAASV